MFESEIEQITLDILREENEYTVLYGPDISEGENKEREYTEVVLAGRLRATIDRLNPNIPADAREEACKRALRTAFTTVIDNNEAFHRLLTDGVDVKFGIGEGKTRTDKVWLIDFANPDNNEFLAINQFTVLENHNNKRPDIVLFINGLPLVVVELKNPADENADVQAAFNQLQTYPIGSTVRASAEPGNFVREHPGEYGLPTTEDQPQGEQTSRGDLAYARKR